MWKLNAICTAWENKVHLKYKIGKTKQRNKNQQQTLAYLHWSHFSVHVHLLFSPFIPMDNPDAKINRTITYNHNPTGRDMSLRSLWSGCQDRDTQK